MGFGWQEIDKTLDLGYIRVAGLHRECKPAVLFDPPNFRPRTMTHIHMYSDTMRNMYVHTYIHSGVCTVHMFTNVCMFVCTVETRYNVISYSEFLHIIVNDFM